MKKKRRDWDLEILTKYIILLAITPIAMVLAYESRGYYAIGGEVLIVPMIFVLRACYKTFKGVINC